HPARARGRPGGRGRLRRAPRLTPAAQPDDRGVAGSPGDLRTPRFCPQMLQMVWIDRPSPDNVGACSDSAGSLQYAWPAALCGESALRAADGPGRSSGDPVTVQVAIDRERRLRQIPGVRITRTHDLDLR